MMSSSGSPINRRLTLFIPEDVIRLLGLITKLKRAIVSGSALSEAAPLQVLYVRTFCYLSLYKRGLVYLPLVHPQMVEDVMSDTNQLCSRLAAISSYKDKKDYVVSSSSLPPGYLNAT